MAITEVGFPVLKDVIVVPCDTLITLKTYTNLIVGRLYETKGYNYAGDGGGGLYLLEAGNTGDGYVNHNVGANTLKLQHHGEIDVKQTGVVSGSTNNIVAFQAALDNLPSGGVLMINNIDFSIGAAAKIKRDGITIRGGNRRTSIIRGLGNHALFESDVKDTATRKDFHLENLMILPHSSLTTYAIDMRSMQFARVSGLLILMSGGPGQRAFRVDAILGTTECSHSVYSDIVIGGGYGFSIGGVANSLTFRNIRVQPPLAGTYAFDVIPPAGSYCNNLRFIDCAIEYPGNVSNGIRLTATGFGDVYGVKITGTRFESLAKGVVISELARDVDCSFQGNYFSSCTNNIDTAATCNGLSPHISAACSFDASGVLAASPRYNITSVTKNATGTFTLVFTVGIGVSIPNITARSGSDIICTTSALSNTSATIRFYDAAGVLVDPVLAYCSFLSAER